MDVVRTCPLGATCERAVDGHIERCMWFVEVNGVDEKSQPVSQSKCSMEWDVILQVEANTLLRGHQQVFESTRNRIAEAINGTKAITNS